MFYFFSMKKNSGLLEEMCAYFEILAPPTCWFDIRDFMCEYNIKVWAIWMNIRWENSQRKMIVKPKIIRKVVRYDHCNPIYFGIKNSLLEHRLVALVEFIWELMRYGGFLYDIWILK